jgi:hypothetical protein
MKRILRSAIYFVIANMIALTAAQAADDYDTLKGVAYLGVYERTCKPGVLTDDTLRVMAIIFNTTPEYIRDKVQRDVVAEITSIGQRRWCALTEAVQGKRIQELNDMARRVFNPLNEPPPESRPTCRDLNGTPVCGWRNY